MFGYRTSLLKDMLSPRHIFAFCKVLDYTILCVTINIKMWSIRQEVNAVDVQVGDTILTRKKHPCGAASFEVLRVGMDFRIRCTGCGREVMLPRAKIEKNIKKIIRPAAEP